MPIKTSSGKWKWGNIERSSKKELVQTVYGIWKKNGSKGSFSDFLKGTHESVEPKDKFFKVKKNGKEIGKYGLSFYDDIKAVGIGDFEVYPEFRNKGYGTKIIKDIVDRYKNDYDKIYCFVDKDNKDAIRLYKRLGKVSDEVTYSQKIGDYEYKNTNGQHYVEFYNKLKESYERPYTLDTIKQKYGVEAYRKLRDDPVHRFRAETGIEVIHKEPTRDEFERIVKNWDLMTPEQKKQSDEFSVKQFGRDNKDRIELLRKEYDFKVGDRVTVRKGLRCRQSGHSGEIIRVNLPEDHDYDSHGFSSFTIKMDDPNLGITSFQSGAIEKEMMNEVQLNEYWGTGKNKDYFFCDDCGKNMSTMPDEQYIMIADKLWAWVCQHPTRGKKKLEKEGDLCRDCIENRLGRPLTLKDLGDKANLPINDAFKNMLKYGNRDIVSELCKAVAKHKVRDEDGDIVSVAFGGNCGIFAYALLMFLNDIDYNFYEWSFGFLFQGIKSLSQIYKDDNNADLNHVVAIIDGIPYDGSGKTNLNEWHGKLFQIDDGERAADIIDQFTVYSIGVNALYKIFKKEWEKLTGKKRMTTNEAHEIHSYPEKLQPIIDRIVKGNEDYELDHAYFNKEGKFIWMRNSKGYFHIFKPIKLKNVKWKPFAFRDLILQDDGMMKPLDLIQFNDGHEGLKYLQTNYHFNANTMI